MMTYKGRVVYDRAKNVFTEKDLIRIFKSMAIDMNFTELSTILVKMATAIMKEMIPSVSEVLRFLLKQIITSALTIGIPFIELFTRLKDAFSIVADAGTQDEFYV